MPPKYKALAEQCLTIVNKLVENYTKKNQAAPSPPPAPSPKEETAPLQQEMSAAEEGNVPQPPPTEVLPQTDVPEADVLPEESPDEKAVSNKFILPEEPRVPHPWPDVFGPIKPSWLKFVEGYCGPDGQVLNPWGGAGDLPEAIANKDLNWDTETAPGIEPFMATPFAKTIFNQMAKPGRYMVYMLWAPYVAQRHGDLSEEDVKLMFDEADTQGIDGVYLNDFIDAAFPELSETLPEELEQRKREKQEEHNARVAKAEAERLAYLAPLYAEAVPRWEALEEDAMNLKNTLLNWNTRKCPHGVTVRLMWVRCDACAAILAEEYDSVVKFLMYPDARTDARGRGGSVPSKPKSGKKPRKAKK